jgi:hypothetical protein
MSTIRQAEVSGEGDDCSDPVVAAQFEVKDDASANWLIRKINECDAYSKRCADWCEREQRRARRDQEFLMFRYGNQLTDFVRRRIAETGGRRKSINLPAGVAGFRTEAEKIVLDDEDAVMAWSREHHPDFIITIEKLSKARLNEHIERTGKIPDVGVHIETAREKFYIK